MSRPARVENEPAFALHHRPYRDTSALVELITPGHGRIGVVARGARRPKSALRAALGPFRPLVVAWSGRGELRTLRSVEPAGPPVFPTGRRLMSLYYMNELILRLTARDDPHPEIFHAYAETLGPILSGARDAPRLRAFELRLLDGLGYAPNLVEEAATGRAIDPEGWYRFAPGEGLTPLSAGGRTEGAIQGRTALALVAGDPLQDADLESARRLLGAALEDLLGGRPLKTRALLRALGKKGLAQ
jgi:DNA repair protein RecO (recombination protein O)